MVSVPPIVLMCAQLQRAAVALEISISKGDSAMIGQVLEAIDLCIDKIVKHLNGDNNVSQETNQQQGQENPSHDAATPVEQSGDQAKQGDE